MPTSFHFVAFLLLAFTHVSYISVIGLGFNVILVFNGFTGWFQVLITLFSQQFLFNFIT